MVVNLTSAPGASSLNGMTNEDIVREGWSKGWREGGFYRDSKFKWGREHFKSFFSFFKSESQTQVFPGSINQTTRNTHSSAGPSAVYAV